LGQFGAIFFERRARCCRSSLARKQFERELDTRLGVSRNFFDCFYLVEATLQTTLIRDLNGQTRTRVDLQNHRSTDSVQNDVHAHVAKTSEVVTACAELQHDVPLRNLQPCQW